MIHGSQSNTDHIASHKEQLFPIQRPDICPQLTTFQMATREAICKNCHELKAVFFFFAFKLKIRFPHKTASSNVMAEKGTFTTINKQTNKIIWHKTWLRYTNPGVEWGKRKEKTMDPSYLSFLFSSLRINESYMHWKKISLYFNGIFDQKHNLNLVINFQAKCLLNTCFQVSSTRTNFLCYLWKH